MVTSASRKLQCFNSLVVYDGRKAARVFNFFERVLRHPKEKGSPPFLLLKWQRWYLGQLFGMVNPDGLRTRRRGYLEMGKKNGKSEFAAGIALYMLFADGEAAAEVYGAATTRDQAGKVFDVAAAMVKASPYLSKQARIIQNTKTIVKRNDPLSFYRAISADGATQDGMNPHCVVMDELHRWSSGRSRELYDVLTKSGRARKQPIAFGITTAGSTPDESPLADMEHEHTLNIEQGVYQDDRFLGKIFAAGVTDDWTKPETWAKANPSLDVHGGFLKSEEIAADCQEAINQPRKANAFKRYSLGLWLSSEQEWMPPHVWDGCATPRRAIVERPCYLGLDLSSTIDLTSLVLLFPDLTDGSFDVLPFFWMARARVRERELADRVPYSAWIDQGFLEATEGDVIDQRIIERKIGWACEVFSVQQFAYDPAHAMQLAINVNGQYGCQAVPVPFRFSHTSEPMKKILELALQKKLRHEGHPILRWNMRCTRARTNENDEIRPVKPERLTSSKRIDGVAAMIAAMSRAMFETPSVYDGRGILTV